MMNKYTGFKNKHKKIINKYHFEMMKDLRRNVLFLLPFFFFVERNEVYYSKLLP